MGFSVRVRIASNIVCNRLYCAPDAQVRGMFRKVILKVHPHRGGSVRDQQKLNDARQRWDQAQNQAKAKARPKTRPTSTSSGVASLAIASEPTPTRKEFRIHSSAVLLTYSGMKEMAMWYRLNDFIVSCMIAWTVKHWCSTLESSSDGQAWHAHVMLQFRAVVDKTSSSFVFEDIRPNIQPQDLCGEGLCRKKLQASINRGFFYTWANKEGTLVDNGELCVAGNYAPCWTKERLKYQVMGAWVDTLWKQRKISNAVYREYLFLTQNGVVSRKRNFDEVTREEERLELTALIAENTQRIRSDPALYRPFPEVPEVPTWLQQFKADALRYPILLLMGPPMCGKTQYACSLFQSPLQLKIGSLLHVPDKLRSFDRKIQDAIILDDIRDLKFCRKTRTKFRASIARRWSSASLRMANAIMRSICFACPWLAR